MITFLLPVAGPVLLQLALLVSTTVVVLLPFEQVAQ
jgi:hypothetical protein